MDLPPLFFEVFDALPRGGPGSVASTQQALDAIPNLPAQPRILDVGCGSGIPARHLARTTGGTVIGTDFFGPTLGLLANKIQEEGLSSQMRCVQGDMTALPFADASFDVIWSEGAIYLMGFQAGLTAWRPLVRPGGCVAVSELSWLRDDRPGALQAYWEREYPGVGSIGQNVARAEDAGYRVLQTFVQPESDWWDAFYVPMEARVAEMRVKYAGDAESQALLDTIIDEVELYRRYSAYYGYVFFVLQP